MFNKPIILSCLISIVYLAAIGELSLLHNELIRYPLSLVILFLFTFYMGISHAKNYKIEIPKSDKIKIALYYFIFWIIPISIIVLSMAANVDLKDVPLFYINKAQGIELLKIFLAVFTYFSINSLLIYLALSMGCKLGLSRINKENL